MKIRSISLTDYRVHRSLNVDFGEDFTVISGPNEAGKSTLLEAVHRALFLHHRTGGKPLATMRSQAGGHPQVQLRFEAQGRSWRLEKTFRGPGGRCHLIDDSSGNSLDGDAAEDRLGELTGQAVVQGRSANAIDQCWDHLYVPQGRTDLDPLSTKGTARLFAALAGREQDDDLVLTSDDSALIEAVRQRVDEEWDAGRKNLRRNGVAGQRERAVEQLQEHLSPLLDEQASRSAQAERLRHHRTDLAAAEESLAAALPRMEAQEQAVTALAQKEATLPPAQDEAAKADDAVAQWQLRCKRAEQHAAAATEAASAVSQSEAARSEADTRYRQQVAQRVVFEQERERKNTALRRAERLAEAAEIRQQSADLDERLTRLEAASQRHGALRSAVAAAKAALDETPRISAADITAIQGAQQAAETARAAVSAIATGITLLEADGPVHLDDRELSPGETLLVDHAGDLRTPEGTLLRILPGGGEDLTSRRTKAEETQRILDGILSQFGVSNLSQAQAQAERYRTAHTELQQAKARLEGSEDPSEDIAAARQQRARLHERWQAMQKSSGNAGESAGASSTDTDAEPAVLRRRAEDLRADVQAVDQSLKELTAAVTAALDQRDTLQRASAAARERLAQAEALVHEDLEALGPAEARAERQAQLEQALASARAAVEAIETSLARDDLAGRRRALALETKRIATTRDQVATLRGQVDALEHQLGGEQTRDLGAQIESVQADLDRARAAAEAARERADADLLLLDVLSDFQRDVQSKREAPFRDACRRYLSLAFDRGGEISWEGEDTKRRLDRIDRSDAGLGNHAFEALSMGARELVALAINCAMAEVLAAEDPDGVIPLILDDSIANVDPARFPQAGLLLAEAAANGIQVILSSCDDRRSHSLGAPSLVRMERSAATPS